MGKRIVKVMSVLQIILCLVAYFSMSIHFDNDDLVFKMLENTDFLGTFLRLSLYLIPGLHLLSGLYGLVFNDKKILIGMSIVELINSGLMFIFIGRSEYMLILAIAASVIAVLYFIGVLTTKYNYDKK